MENEDKKDRPVVDKPVETKPKDTPKTPSKGKRMLIASGAIMAGLGAAYGGGRLQGHSAVSESEDRRGKTEAEAQSIKRDLDAANAKIKQLDARRHLHLALMSMEQRNFGIAQEHVTSAGTLLQASSPEGELKKLADELRAFKLTASEDQSKERQALLGFAEKLDKILPPAKP